MAAPTSTQSPLRPPLPEPVSPPVAPTASGGGLGSRILGVGRQMLRTGPVGAVMGAHYTATHPDNVRRVMAEQTASLHEPVKVRYTDGSVGVPTQQQLDGPSPAVEPASTAGIQQNLAAAGARASAALPGLRTAAQQEALRLGEPDPTAPAVPRAATPAAAPTTAPTATMDQSFEQLRRGNAPGGGFEQQARFSGPTHSVYSRANPNNPGGTDPTVSKNEYIGVGAPEDPAAVAARAEQQAQQSLLRQITSAMGNSGNGGTAPAPRSNAHAINKRFDQLAERFGNMYGPRGQGNLARRLLELESQRASALDADTRNQSVLRGQDTNASTAANNTNLQALQTLGMMSNQRSQLSAQARDAQLKALQDAQAAARQGEEKGFERYNGAISSMFVGPDGTPDAAEQERFTSFLQASDPQAQQKFAAMSPQNQMVLLQNFKTMYDMQRARNTTAERGGGAITNRADMPVDVREATWNDVWNNNLPLGDYVWSNMPRTNPNVVVSESGQPVLVSDYATTDGNWDADKLDLIRQRTGKDQNARSVLRGN